MLGKDAANVRLKEGKSKKSIRIETIKRRLREIKGIKGVKVAYKVQVSYRGQVVKVVQSDIKATKRS